MPDPVFKIVSGPSPTMKGLANATTEGMASLISAVSSAADVMPLDPEELLGVLHFRLHEAEKAQRRAAWIGGRLYNRFSGEDPGYVPVSGTHLSQTLNLVKIETPDFVVARGQYLLRFDQAKAAYEQLKKMLQYGS